MKMLDQQSSDLSNEYEVTNFTSSLLQIARKWAAHVVGTNPPELIPPVVNFFRIFLSKKRRKSLFWPIEKCSVTTLNVTTSLLQNDLIYLWKIEENQTFRR